MGHSWDEIQNLTMPQIKLFAKASEEIERERRANLIGDLRMAAWGKGDDVGQIIKALKGEE